jgi:hypothetical protein
MNRIYANIKLPIDVFPNGQFKMLYDQMKIEVEMPNKNEELQEKIMEMKDEMVENIVENSHRNIEEEEGEEEGEEGGEEKEIKIFKSDFTLNKNKKRVNTTFRKWNEKNTITKKKYMSLHNHSV